MQSERRMEIYLPLIIAHRKRLRGNNKQSLFRCAIYHRKEHCNIKKRKVKWDFSSFFLGRYIDMDMVLSNFSTFSNLISLKKK